MLVGQVHRRDVASTRHPARGVQRPASPSEEAAHRASALDRPRRANYLSRWDWTGYRQAWTMEITSVQGERYRVVVVDDNPDIAAWLADELEVLGHDVRTAHDGPTSLALASSFDPTSCSSISRCPGWMAGRSPGATGSSVSRSCRARSRSVRSSSARPAGPSSRVRLRSRARALAREGDIIFLHTAVMLRLNPVEYGCFDVDSN